ncbi:MAG: CPBP family intramembrane metalloprotease [Flavobacteriaceae bacterium]|nr:CPBP family intramembrane metalloprotease [Flavobacteriaceae bacterium]
MKYVTSNGGIYLITTLTITALSVLVIHQLQLDRSFYRYTVTLPGILALVFLFLPKLSNIRFPDFLRQFKVSGKIIKWLLLSLFLYTILSYVASAISAIAFNGNFIWLPNFQIPLSKMGLIFVLAFFEEIGWRGFALSQLLEKFNFVQSSLFVGVVWALWHFPGYLVGFGAPNDIPFVVFSLWVIASSFVFSWLYLKSNKSVWTAILLHFGANMTLQLYPIMPSPAKTSATFYIMTLLVVGIAIVLSIKSKQFKINY